MMKDGRRPPLCLRLGIQAKVTTAGNVSLPQGHLKKKNRIKGSMMPI